MSLQVLLLSAVPLAWLLPNHYLPWLSAWQEGFALAMLLLAAVLRPRAVVLPVLWCAALALAAASVAVQWATGHIFFSGDALMALVYLAAFTLSIGLGSTLVDPEGRGQPAPALDAVALGMVLCATVSVGIALVQWTSAIPMGIYGAELPPGERPFANVAQPNHLNTLCFMALCAIGLLWQSGRVRGGVFWLAAAWFALGMLLSGSRTGWFQLTVLSALLLLMGPRSAARLSIRAMAGFLAAFAALVLIWPNLSEWLLLASGRAHDEVAQIGTRRSHWAMMLDAIAQQPWWGYGWQQVSVAQVRVADAHPHVGEQIEHSHNLILDLMVWAGAPLGALLAGLTLGWFVSRVWRCGSPQAFWLLAAVGGLGVHAMLEYPLEYAYFLIPFGLLVGAIDRMHAGGRGIRLGRWTVGAGTVMLTAVLALVGLEYLKAEQSHRLLRFESAGIGASHIQAPPELHLLTQLLAFQQFAQQEARVGMAPEEVDRMRRVSERFAYPSVMFRYALASGLNSQPEHAALTLRRLCLIHPVRRCEEARSAWQGLQSRYPALLSVAPPDLPPNAITLR